MGVSGNHLNDDQWFSRMWRWALAGTAVLFVITALAVANSLSMNAKPKSFTTPIATPDGSNFGGDPVMSASPEATDPAAGKDLKKIAVTTTPTPTATASPTPKTSPVAPSIDAPDPGQAAVVNLPTREQAPAEPTPDNCPGGDYTSSRYDGRCGSVPVTPTRDNCPGGDYSGNAYDGSCGSAPQVSSGSAVATITECTLDTSTGTQKASARVSDPEGAGYTLVMTIGDKTQTFPRVSGTHIFYFERFATYSKLPCTASLN